MTEKQQVSMQHIVRKHGNQMFFFYDGMLEAKDGLLTIPSDRPEWIRRAWVSGYRLTPDGRPLNTWPDVEGEVRRQSAESTEENGVKDTGDRGQPKTGNRVRPNK